MGSVFKQDPPCTDQEAKHRARVPSWVWMGGFWGVFMTDRPEDPIRVPWETELSLYVEHFCAFLPAHP